MADSLSNRRGRPRKSPAPSEPPSEHQLGDVGEELPVLSFVQERLRQVLAENERLQDELEAASSESLRLRREHDAKAAEKELRSSSAEISRLQKEVEGARADSDRLRALLEKESGARRAAEAEASDLRSLSGDIALDVLKQLGVELRNADSVIARLRNELEVERRARAPLQAEVKELRTLAEELPAARKKIGLIGEQLTQESETRRSLEAALKATKAKAKQTESALHKEIKDLRVSQAMLDEQITGVQRQLEIKQEELQAKELEVNRRLEAIRSLEGEVMARRADIERTEITLEKARKELDNGWSGLHSHQKELQRWQEELESQKSDPRVIRLDDIDEQDVDEKELLAMLIAEQRGRGVAEAELLRVRERAALLEHELSRLKQQSPTPGRGRHRRR
jgi:chromosome segregation ATPase